MPDFFMQTLLAWFQANGRHDLPWQQPRTPYRVWVSEIMLQQTQVVTVIPYFERFMQRFPTLSSLAEARVDDVLALWSGLGYYSRARNLHQAAKQLVEAGYQELPDDFEFLLKLRGVGRSTAGAIMAQAFNQPYPILDGNVRRVLCRFHQIDGWPGTTVVQKQLWQLAAQHTPQTDVVNYTQAIMDFGATLCTTSRPQCDRCPLAEQCQAHCHDVVAQYPNKRVKKSIPTRRTQMLIMVNPAGEVLLERRPPSGIWGGMWSLPQWDGEVELSQWVELHHQLKVLRQSNYESFIHIFSHFRLEIYPICLHVEERRAAKVMESEATLWYKSELITQLGIPAPVKRLLQDHENRLGAH
jgi:A/G-specific adenine glycosylase